MLYPAHILGTLITIPSRLRRCLRSGRLSGGRPCACRFFCGRLRLNLSGFALLSDFPTRHPGFHRHHFLLPITDERSRVGIFAWVCAEALANRIHPDIPGDACCVIAFPENVIVKFLLPQHLAMPTMIFVRGRSLEILHKCQQVARRLLSRKQSVKMIGHHAISVHRKPKCDRLFPEVFDQPKRILRVCKHRPPACAAQRNEARKLADILNRVKPNVLVSEWHSEYHASRESIVMRGIPEIKAPA